MIRTTKNLNNRSSGLTRASVFYQKASRRVISSCPLLPSLRAYNITISHEKKFVWFRVAKVALTTTFDVFAQANVQLDAEQPYHCHYPTNLYRDYFKFAFVRNPWDRLISCWYDKVVTRNSFKLTEQTRLELQTFRNFVEYVAELDINECNIHIRRQSALIDLNQIDFLGRFETLESDMMHVIRNLELGEIKLEKKNASIGRKAYPHYYDEALIQKVADIYHKDVRMFGYDF